MSIERAAESKEQLQQQPICSRVPGIIVPSFLWFIGLFMFFALLNQILIAQVCLHTDNDDCDSSEVSSKASSMSVVVTLTATVPQLLFNGFFCSMSDIYGRKYPLAIASMGNIVFIFSTLVVTFTDTPNYFYWLVAGSLVSGLSGGIPIFIMTVFAYAADETRHDPARRSLVYGITEASIFVPNMISGVTAGSLASAFGFTVPLVVSMASTTLCAVWIIFMRESLPADAETRQSSLKFDILETFRNIWFLLSHKVGGVAGTSPVPLISFAFFFFFAMYWGDASIVVFYLKHTFHWDSSLIGYFQSSQSTVYVVSMVLAPTIAEKLTGSTFRLLSWIQIGYFARVVYWAVFGLAPSVEVLYANLALLLLTGPVVPYSRAVLSNSVAHYDQARVFSGFAGLETIASFLSVIITIGYSMTVEVGFAQGMFFAGALIALLSFALVTYAKMSATIAPNLPDSVHFVPVDGTPGKDYRGASKDRVLSTDQVSVMSRLLDDVEATDGIAVEGSGDDGDLQGRSESIDMSSVTVAH